MPVPASPPDPRRVFLSYSHDGEVDARRVALLRLLRGQRDPALTELAEKLAADGSDAVRGAARQVLEAAKSPASASRADVFLVHGAGDRRPAKRLARHLRSHSLTVDLPSPQKPWDAPSSIDRMLESFRVFVLAGVDTPEPDDVCDALALFEGEAVVITLPGEPRPTVPESLADLRQLDLPSFDAGVEALIEAAPAPATLPIEADVIEAKIAVQVPSVIVGQPSTASFTEPLTGELFLPVPAGSFEMGGTVHADEQPVHRVRLSAFWLARTPVTNRQYRLFLEATEHEEPSYWRDRRFSEPDQPVVGVSWLDATAYCRWLSQQSSTRLFELPTEAQWEYAARGADGREFPWGNEPPDSERACFGLESDTGQPATVGSFPAGAGPFGHLDLAGNVWEWCRDSWEEDYSRWAVEEVSDPIGSGDSDSRPLRGGAWWDDAADLRSAFRSGLRPGYRGDLIGFRVSCSASSTDS